MDRTMFLGRGQKIGCFMARLVFSCGAARKRAGFMAGMCLASGFIRMSVLSIE